MGPNPKRMARSGKRPGVFAPVVWLNEVIRKRNQLLDLCETRVLMSAEDRREAVELGAQILADLSRFRKTELPSSEETSVSV